MGLVIFLAATWLLILIAVVLEFAGIRQAGTWWRWQGTGLLLGNGAGLVITFARFRGWSWSHQMAIDAILVLMTVAGLVLILVGTMKLGRGRRAARQVEAPVE